MLKQACIYCQIAGGIAIAGAINMGIVGMTKYNVLDHIFGAGSIIDRIVYVIIGIAGVALLTSFFMVCPHCKK